MQQPQPVSLTLDATDANKSEGLAEFCSRKGAELMMVASGSDAGAEGATQRFGRQLYTLHRKVEETSTSHL